MDEKLLQDIDEKIQFICEKMKKDCFPYIVAASMLGLIWGTLLVIVINS